MPATHRLANIAKSTWRIVVQPAQFARNRAARYRAAGHAAPSDLVHLPVDLMSPREGCEPRCAYMVRLTAEHLSEYRRCDRDWRWRPWLGTAAAIPLRTYDGAQSYLDFVARRTNKAFARSVAKARRLGYGTSLFPPQNFEAAMSAILGSRLVRSGGLVPYAVLPRRRPAPDRGLPPNHRPRVWCRHHWTLHFGVFAPAAEPAFRQLVGFVKLRRAGSLVHALQIMGHGDHMAAGVNDLMHADLMRWLLDDPDRLAAGVTHYLYGAIEHSGDGLAQWKLRRGFEPLLLDLGPSAEGLRTATTCANNPGRRPAGALSGSG